jgi:peptide-methionine (R)-S-oxide reductase
MSTLTRRAWLGSAAAGLALGLAGRGLAAKPEDAFAASPFRRLTEADWKARLPAASFDVLRKQGTETPFTSPLNNEHRQGVFACLGCDLPLFRSDWKFNSGTGWPSFFRGIDDHIGKRADFLLGYERTEYHCARCLGHQGHLFDDGPQPTGLRYCNDGVALKFIPA